MKNSWQIVTILTAVALVAMAIKITILKSDEKSLEIDESEIVFNSIMTRSSVRSYTTEVVESYKVEKLLKAAMAAPSAGNRQPWEFIVVTERAILDKFPKIVAASQMATKSQLAIVVVGTPSKALMDEYWVQDCSAASENILLAAHALGLGAVWCGAYPNNETDRAGEISALLSLPKGSYALNIIVIGYPDSKPAVKDKWDPTKIHYNKY